MLPVSLFTAQVPMTMNMNSTNSDLMSEDACSDEGSDDIEEEDELAIDASTRTFRNEDVERKFVVTLFHSTMSQHAAGYLLHVCSLCCRPLVNPHTGNVGWIWHLVICTIIFGIRVGYYFVPCSSSHLATCEASARNAVVLAFILYALGILLKPPHLQPDPEGTPEQLYVARAIVTLVHMANVSYMMCMASNGAKSNAPRWATFTLLVLAAARGNIACALEPATCTALVVCSIAVGVAANYLLVLDRRKAHVESYRGINDAVQERAAGLSSAQSVVERQWVLREAGGGGGKVWEYARRLKMD